MGERGVSAAAETPLDVPFPDVAFFEQLAAFMREDRARQEQLGYIDCAACFVVEDGTADGFARHFLVTFEEFEATDVREVDAAGAAGADFALVATLATWRAMIESIAAGGGRPALEQTLNRLSHMGTPMKLEAPDAVKADLYFRYNQSLQEFFNASARLRTHFPDPA